MNIYSYLQLANKPNSNMLFKFSFRVFFLNLRVEFVKLFSQSVKHIVDPLKVSGTQLLKVSGSHRGRGQGLDHFGGRGDGDRGRVGVSRN